jgi:two-component system phosphate regulon sensor histidine kinase PhoR
MDQPQLHAVIAAIPLPLLLLDAGGRVRAANPPALDLLGGDPVGRSYLAALRQPAALDCVEAALGRRTRAVARIERAGPAGDTAWRLTATPLADASGGALLSFEEIGHVEEAEQMRRDFVANVSHELRSPLTALTGFIETLAGAARDDAAARARFLKVMAAEALRMERLVGDLLSLARVEAEERIRPTARVDLAALLEAAVAALGPHAAAAGVEMRLSGTGAPIALAGDADQLTQVFHNLIGNALDHGGGEVAIEATVAAQHPALRGPAVAVAVADRGAGIAPAHLPRLTERFYRVDAHRARAGGGTGLGLAIVKHIVNRHRGRLLIASTPGQGSRFTVVLPLPGAAAAALS